MKLIKKKIIVDFVCLACAFYLFIYNLLEMGINVERDVRENNYNNHVTLDVSLNKN